MNDYLFKDKDKELIEPFDVDTLVPIGTRCPLRSDDMTMTRAYRIFLIVVVIFGVGTAPSHVTAQVDPADNIHAEWTRILKKSVVSGFVDYKKIKNEQATELDHYLETLKNVTRATYSRWSRAEKLAFWINVYNAFTVKLIVDNHPVESIQWMGYLPGAVFRRSFIDLRGLRQHAYSLDEIESVILRERFNEPRVHFAIVRASKGGPLLRSEAYRGSILDAQLSAATQSFLSDSRKNRVEGGTLWLSSIFDWFREDFDKAAGSVQRFVGRYLELEPGREYEIKHLEFDWSLNGQ